MICIDPGHGGRDSGAVGPAGTKESAVALTTAWYVNSLLVMAGAKTLMTRQRDVYVSLSERYTLANARGADLFVSIHANSNGPGAHGFECYHYLFSPQGIALATAVRDAVAAANIWRLGAQLAMRGPRNGLKSNGKFAVLCRTKMPAVLIEPAFISNPAEEALLASDSGQLAFARAIVAGLGRLL